MDNNLIIDAHTHIGEWGVWEFSGYSIDPFSNKTHRTKEDCVKYMAKNDIDYMIVMPLYTPVVDTPFQYGNPLVLEIIEQTDNIAGGIWFSPTDDTHQYFEDTFELADNSKIVNLKSAPNSWNGNYSIDPNTWPTEVRRKMELIIGFAEGRNIPIQFHCSGGGKSDPQEFEGFVKKYGQNIKIHFVHMGFSVRGHFSFVPRFLEWLLKDYKVYCDTSLANSFSIRWLVRELKQHKLFHGFERIMFATDYPWGDFLPEYWKIKGLDLESDLKSKILGNNAYTLYFEK